MAMNLVYNEITGEFEEVVEYTNSRSNSSTNSIEEFKRMYIYKRMGIKARDFVEELLNQGYSIRSAMGQLKKKRPLAYDNTLDRLHQFNPGVGIFDVESYITRNPKPTKSRMEIWIDSAKDRLGELGFRYNVYRRFDLPSSYTTNHGKRWTTVEEERLKAMYAAGFTVQSMAISLKRKYSPVISRLTEIYGDRWSTSDTEVNRYGYRVLS